VRNKFNATIPCINTLAQKPIDAPLYKTRLRNQADFYSLFVAVSDSLSSGIDCGNDDIVTRLADFVATVEDEALRSESPAASDYFTAARSNSNDTGPRKKRHDIILRVINNTINDYPGTDTEQIQVG